MVQELLKRIIILVIKIAEGQPPLHCLQKQRLRRKGPQKHKLREVEFNEKQLLGKARVNLKRTTMPRVKHRILKNQGVKQIKIKEN